MNLLVFCTIKSPSIGIYIYIPKEENIPLETEANFNIKFNPMWGKGDFECPPLPPPQGGGEREQVNGNKMVISDQLSHSLSVRPMDGFPQMLI